MQKIKITDAKLIDLLYAGASKTTLASFVHQLAMNNPEFKILRQCDAHELYLYLIDTLYSNKNFKFNNVFQDPCNRQSLRRL